MSGAVGLGVRIVMCWWLQGLEFGFCRLACAFGSLGMGVSGQKLPAPTAQKQNTPPAPQNKKAHAPVSPAPTASKEHKNIGYKTNCLPQHSKKMNPRRTNTKKISNSKNHKTFLPITRHDVTSWYLFFAAS